MTTCRRLTKAINDPNAPIEIISATSDDLFKAYLGRKAELPSFDGELLMDVHATGCYTSQTAMKYYNRRNEELTGAAERASVAATGSVRWLTTSGNSPRSGSVSSGTSSMTT